MAGLEKKENAYTALVSIPEEKKNLGNLGVDGRRILTFRNLASYI